MKIRLLVLVLFTVSLVALSALLPGAGPATLAAQAGVDQQLSPADWSAIYLPITVAPPPIHLVDDFESGVGKWTPFVNYWRLNPQQWFWDRFQGYQGSNAYTHNWCRGLGDCDRGAHDTLTMYLGPGSEQWTDYRFKVRFNAEAGRQAGVWFRGTYREVETRGQWLTGYYFTVNVRAEGTGKAKLWQLRTAEEHGQESTEVYWYHFSNPMLLAEKDLTTPVNHDQWQELRVEVQGPRIKCYVGNELAFDYTDTEGSIFLKGTIGLYAYGSDPRYAIVRFDDVFVEPLGAK